MTDPQPAPSPDLTGATIYVETRSPSTAQGRWHIVADGTVYFERDKTGEIVKALIPASTLRNSATWIALSS